jgi:hypothetical protein
MWAIITFFVLYFEVSERIVYYILFKNQIISLVFVLYEDFQECINRR